MNKEIYRIDYKKLHELVGEMYTLMIKQLISSEKDYLLKNEINVFPLTYRVVPICLILQGICTTNAFSCNILTDYQDANFIITFEYDTRLTEMSTISLLNPQFKADLKGRKLLFPWDKEYNQ